MILEAYQRYSYVLMRSATSPQLENSPKSHLFLRAWLVCVAFSYPIFWLGNFLTHAAPALVQVVFFGYHLGVFRVLPFGAYAWSSPPEDFDPFHPHPMTHVNLASGSLVWIVLACAALVIILSRKEHLLAGLFLATLSNFALAQQLALIFYSHHATLATVIAALFFFAALCWGLRAMLPAGIENYWSRIGFLLAAFVFPLTLLPLVLTRSPVQRNILLLATPAIGVALLSSLSGRLRFQNTGAAPGWKLIMGGAVVSALLFYGIRGANYALEQKRLSATHAILASLPSVPAQTSYRKVFFQKGANFTAEFPATYDSAQARRMLELLPSYGVDSVALVPYGWSTSRAPRVRISSGAGSWENDLGIEELARVAHARGMKVFLKPAVWLAYNIQLSNVQDRRDWFQQYSLFVEHYAQLAARIHADLFSVGGEFEHLSQDDAEWRKVIAQARQRYPGPIVYAANFGSEFEHIQFWDALDYIGLQEYYPLPDNLSTQSMLAKIKAVEERFHRPVIFTEVGFPSQAGANRRPWDDGSHASVSVELQRECYEAIFRTFFEQPWFEGMYWWKIGSNGYGGPQDSSHTPWGKPAMEVIKQWYLRGGR
jgi:hypothetical protein